MLKSGIISTANLNQIAVNNCQSNNKMLRYPLPLVGKLFGSDWRLDPTIIAARGFLLSGYKPDLLSNGDAQMKNIVAHPLYRRWRSMKTRCYYPGHKSYHSYGGRGITVCEGFRDFDYYASVMIAPPFEKAQVDRIDNDGHYSCGECNQCKANKWPLNLQWATPKQQANNRRFRQGYLAYRDGDPFEVDHLAKLLGLDVDVVMDVMERPNERYILTDVGMEALAQMVRERNGRIEPMQGEQLQLFDQLPAHEDAPIRIRIKERVVEYSV